MSDSRASEAPLGDFLARMPQASAPCARAAAALVAAGSALGGRAVGGTDDVWSGGRGAELEALRVRVLEGLDEFDEASERLRSAEATDGDPEERRARVRKARRRAVELPLEVMEAGVAALRILAVGAPTLEGEEAAVGAASARVLAAGVDAGRPDLDSALVTLDDPEWGERHRMAADALSAEAAALFDEVRRETESTPA